MDVSGSASGLEKREIPIQPKVAHAWRAQVESTFTVEFRPTLRIWEFFMDLFALPTAKRGNPCLGDLARLARAYADEFLYVPYIPISLQRALAVPLSKLSWPAR